MLLNLQKGVRQRKICYLLIQVQDTLVMHFTVTAGLKYTGRDFFVSLKGDAGKSLRLLHWMVMVREAISSLNESNLIRCVLGQDGWIKPTTFLHGASMMRLPCCCKIHTWGGHPSVNGVVLLWSYNLKKEVTPQVTSLPMVVR